MKQPTQFPPAVIGRSAARPAAALTAWRALAGLERQLSRETSPAALFPDPPVIHFRSGAQSCDCGAALLVRKTHRRQVWTLSGPLVAHQTVQHCPDCGGQVLCEELSCLVSPHSRVGYDVLVFVGRALFQRYRTAEEVVGELAARNVRLSAAQIGYLGRKFILYLAAAHARAVPRVEQAMRLRGGYVLHLDAMHQVLAGDRWSLIPDRGTPIM